MELFGDELGTADARCLTPRSVHVSGHLLVRHAGHLRVLQCQHSDQRQVGAPRGHRFPELLCIPGAALRGRRW